MLILIPLQEKKKNQIAMGNQSILLSIGKNYHKVDLDISEKGGKESNSNEESIELTFS